MTVSECTSTRMSAITLQEQMDWVKEAEMLFTSSCPLEFRQTQHICHDIRERLRSLAGLKHWDASMHTLHRLLLQQSSQYARWEGEALQQELRRLKFDEFDFCAFVEKMCENCLADQRWKLAMENNILDCLQRIFATLDKYCDQIE